MRRHLFFILTTNAFLCIFCEQPQQKQPPNHTAATTDTVKQVRKSRRYTFDSTTVVAVKPTRKPPSSDFQKMYSIARGLNYTPRHPIQQTDSIDFRCWTWVHSEAYEQLTERLVYKGVATHYITFKEITPKSFKKGFLFEEVTFPSEAEALSAGKQIRDFIFKDSTTVAYDKLPTDIFQYKNRIYQLKVGAFMSIPDMKTASGKFRKMLGPAVVEIMLWDMYGYGEED